MSEVLRHYDEVLGAVYSWSVGSLEARVAASEALFRSMLGAGREGGRARRVLDLGCGTGIQSLALGRLGFMVTGIDFSETMLREYRERTAPFGTEVVCADLATFSVAGPFDAAVCLGDTVSHLPSWAAVDAMLRNVASSLAPGSGFVLATRDHTRVYEGDARFLLVRADAERSLTCFLEDAGEHVRVTDLLHERGETGTRMTAHSYLKLRVSPDRLTEHMARAELDVVSCEEWSGVHVLFARRRDT